MVFLIAAIAIALVGIRPARIHSWVWPVGGAVVVVALGYEPLVAAAHAVAQQWNVLLFILGLMGLSAAADESGAFAWLTQVLLERADGSRKRLFVLIFIAAALMTFVLSNDATAIVLTPLVYQTVSKRIDTVMPYLFACIFVADTASFGFPFSNPANVLILAHPHLLPYLWHLGPPELAAIAINLGLFLFFFRSQLRGRYAFTQSAQLDRRSIRTLVALACVAGAYLVALGLHWPLGPVAAIGALCTLAAATVSPSAAARHVTWRTFALLAGLFALLDAVARAGFVQWALDGLQAVSHYGSLATIAVATVGAALLSNLLNNLPVAVAASYVVAHASSQHLAYPLIAGVDLGPNLLTTGSLATILWLSVLRDRGIRVSILEYLRLGSVVVPTTLAVTVLWLWAVTSR